MKIECLNIGIVGEERGGKPFELIAADGFKCGEQQIDVGEYTHRTVESLLDCGDTHFCALLKIDVDLVVFEPSNGGEQNRTDQQSDKERQERCHRQEKRLRINLHPYAVPFSETFVICVSRNAS
jgi:hypothetical protein